MQAGATVVTEETHITFLDNAPVIDYGLTGTVTTYKSSAATSTDFSSQTECDFMTSGGALNNHDIFAPNVNPSKTGQWQATFTLDNPIGRLLFSTVQLTTLGYNSTGAYQNSDNLSAPKGTTVDGSAAPGKYVGFTVEYSLDGITWEQVGSTYSIDMVSSNANARMKTTDFTMDGAAEFDAGSTVYLRVTTSRDYTSGTFAGLKSITLSSDIDLTDVSWTGGNGVWTETSFDGKTVEGGAVNNYFTLTSAGFSEGNNHIAVTLDSVIAPGGILVDAGEGNAYALEGQGGFSGRGILNVASGTLQINTTDNAGWIGAISIGEGAVLELQSGHWDIGDRLSSDSAGTLALSGTSTASIGNASARLQVGRDAILTLSGSAYDNAFAGEGTIVVNSQAITLNRLSTEFSGIWQVEQSGKLIVGASAAQNGQMALAGTGKFEMMGSGTVTLAGAPEKQTIGQLFVGQGRVEILQDLDVTGTAAKTGLSVGINGSLTIGNGTDAVTVTTKLFFGANNGTAGEQSVTVAQNASLVVTGSSNDNGDARNSSIVLGHWNGAMTMTVEGLFQAEKAKIYTTHAANAADTKLVIAGTGTLNALGISKDTYQTTANGGTIILEDGAHMNLGSAGVTKVASFQAGAAVVGSFADAWSSNQDMTLTSHEALTFHTGKYDLAAKTYSATEGTSITLSGTLSDADGIAGSIAKTGVGTLTLQGANTYTGQTIVEQGTLALTGNGSLGSGELKVKNAENTQLTTSTMTVAAHGGDASLSGFANPVTASSTELSGASASAPAQVSHASVTLNDAAAAYRFENMEWKESELVVQQAASVALSHVVLGEGTTLSNAAASSLSITDSALVLGPNGLSGDPALSPDGTVCSLSYDMAGASVSGSFTLDFSTELLKGLAGMAENPVNNLQITLENVAAWSVEDDALLWEGNAAWLGPETVSVRREDGSVVIDVAFAAAIPEPASSTLALLGLTGWLLRRRRKA